MAEITQKGVVEIPSDKGGMTMRLSWEEEFNKEAGTSKIIITGLDVKSSKWYWVSYFPRGSISADSEDIISFSATSNKHFYFWNSLNQYAPIRVQNGGVLPPWSSSSFGRDNNGTKTITLNVNIYFNTIYGGSANDNGWSVNKEIKIDLTPTKEIVPEPEIKIAPFDLSLYYNGNATMAIYNKKLIVMVIHPGKINEDNSIIGYAKLGSASLGNGG